MNTRAILSQSVILACLVSVLWVPSPSQGTEFDPWLEVADLQMDLELHLRQLETLPVEEQGTFRRLNAGRMAARLDVLLAQVSPQMTAGDEWRTAVLRVSHLLYRLREGKYPKASESKVVAPKSSSISGRLTDRASDSPVAGFVRLFDQTSYQLQRVATDNDGNYVFGSVDPGRYYLWAAAEAYASQAYENQPCLPGEIFFMCDFSNATLVAVAADSATEGIDFALDRQGGISGRILSAESGAGINAAIVDLHYESGEVAQATVTDFDGFYLFEDVAPGTYYVATLAAPEHIDGVFADLDCFRIGDAAGCDVTTGTPITVEADQITTGIDLSLQRAAHISGRLVRQVTREPIGGVEVLALTPDHGWITGTISDAQGNYRLSGLDSGSYRVVTRGETHSNEIYDDVPCPRPFLEDCPGATEIAVTRGRGSSGIDFDLLLLGSISGRVTSAETGDGISSATITVFDNQGLVVTSALSDSDGHYSVTGIPESGSYFAWAWARDHITELFDDLPCRSCDPVTGTPITVALGQDSSAIDFDLDRRQGIRGRVVEDALGSKPLQNVWVFAANAAGEAVAEAGTDSTGLFEIDLDPGTYFIYTLNSLGFKDELFDDIPCPDGMCDVTQGRPIVVEPGNFELGPEIALTKDPEVCVASSQSLCLQNQRFEVKARWRSFDGNSGPGYSAPLTAETGYFWFFDDDNVEVIIKVLDACDTYGSLWVFAAGLTNVEVTLTVRDTQTQEIREYHNPLGRTFVPVQDTLAFISCGDMSVRSAAATEQDQTPPEPAPLAEDAMASLSSSLLDLVGSALPSAEDAAKDEPCTYPPCLTGGRFAVEMDWWADDAGGSGRFDLLTRDTGYFTIFPGNVEAVVKVLDACGPPYNRFWVFAAGLTNMGIRLTVTDTETGQKREYLNPFGQAFESILDVEGFDTCP